MRRINLDLKRYVGDKDKRIVHDCDHEKGSNCRIDGIVATNNVVTFSPDTFEQAIKDGFSACPYCREAQVYFVLSAYTRDKTKKTEGISLVLG